MESGGSGQAKPKRRRGLFQRIFSKKDKKSSRHGDGNSVASSLQPDSSTLIHDASFHQSGGYVSMERTSMQSVQDSLRQRQDSDGLFIAHPPQVTGALSNIQNATLHRPHHVSIQNLTSHEFHGHQNIYTGGSHSPLKDLFSYVMLDAMSDASARDPPPRCHPGTRKDILDAIRSRLHTPVRKAQIGWLDGSAGVGKSAIMQTLAEGETGHMLSASLFFSRPNKRNDPKRVFTTIAYQFAVKDPSYQVYVAEQLAADPSLLNKVIEKQFHFLFTIPFTEKKLFGGRNVTILLDGLDECQGEREQCQIIDLIDDFVVRHPDVPLTWIISSRPEEHLKIAFSRVKARPGPAFWEQEVPIDSEQAVQDVEHYLHVEFERIQDSYYMIPPDQKWPSDQEFLTISSAASGLFIFASTIIRFIGDPNYGNPVSRLKHTLSILNEKRLNGKTNPFELLDLFYEAIMAQIPKDVLPTTKRILEYVRLGGEDPNLALVVCNFLGLECDVFQWAVRKLHSVLEFPEPSEAYTYPIRFRHASFSDYLSNPERSHMYSIDRNDVMEYIWRRSMTIKQQGWNDESCRNVQLCWTSGGTAEEIESLKCDVFDMSEISWKETLRYHFGIEVAEDNFHFPVPLSELVEHIKILDFSSRNDMGSFSFHRFIIRLREREAEDTSGALNNLFRVVPLTTLDRKQLFKSLMRKHWFYSDGRVDNQLSELLGTGIKEINCEEELQKVEKTLRKSLEINKLFELLGDARASSWTMTIVGGHPSRCCGWVEYEQGLGLRERLRGTFYCAFPYITQDDA